MLAPVPGARPRTLADGTRTRSPVSSRHARRGVGSGSFVACLGGILVAVAALSAAGSRAPGTDFAPPVDWIDGRPPGVDTVVVRPGDPRVEAERLVPHRATWQVRQLPADGEPTVTGFRTEMYAWSTEDGRPVTLLRQFQVDTVGVLTLDIEAVFERSSFRPIRIRERLPASGVWAESRYADGSVSGRLKPDAETAAREFHTDLPEPVWDPFNALLFFMDWQEGDVIRYPIWNRAGEGAVTIREIRVEAPEELALPDGETVRTWRAVVSNRGGPGWTMWVRPEPPYFWRLKIERASGTWEWILEDYVEFE